MSSSSVSSAVREITVAHSPDSDDAFMFYALATNKVRVPGLKFSHTLTDIETLNRKAMEGFYDVSAISFHAYPYVQDKYALMPCGGSVGEQYGPMVISPRMVGLEELKTHEDRRPGHHDDGISCAETCLRRKSKPPWCRLIASFRKFWPASMKQD